MNQKELDQKLVKDIVEIYDETYLWGPTGQDLTRQSKLDLITTAYLNKHGGEEFIIRNITKVLDSKSSTGYLTKEFLTNTITLLKYRIDKKDSLEQIHIQSEDSALDSTAISYLKTNLNNPGDNAVLQYRAVLEAGSRSKLKESLRNALMRSDISVRITTVEPGDLREKNNYLGHRIWSLIPARPIVVISIDK